MTYEQLDELAATIKAARLALEANRLQDCHLELARAAGMIPVRSWQHSCAVSPTHGQPPNSTPRPDHNALTRTIHKRGRER